MSSISNSPSLPQGQGYAVAAASRSTTKRGRVPASNKAILGLRHITAAADCGSSTECAICLQDFDFDIVDAEMPLSLRALPCSHTFHQHCISRWLHRDAVCPICRHQLPTEEELEDAEEERRFGRRMRRGVLVFCPPGQEEDIFAAALEDGIILEHMPRQQLQPHDVEQELQRRMWVNDQLSNWRNLVARLRADQQATRTES